MFFLSKDLSIYSFFLGGLFFSSSDCIEEGSKIAKIKFMYFFFFLVFLGAFSYGQVSNNVLWGYILISLTFFVGIYFFNKKMHHFSDCS
jgi:hypothetical protein